MIPRSRFKTMVEQKLIASVRVVPIPMDTHWCIDAIIRMPMEAGSATDTVSTSQRQGRSGGALRRFRSIDEAATFLKQMGVSSFTVDTQDSIRFADMDEQEVHYIERSVQVWADDDDAVNSPVA